MANGTQIGPFLVAPFPARKNWKVEIHKRVFGKTKRRFFSDQGAAMLWAAEQNNELEKGQPVTLEKGRDSAGSVSVLVASYLADRKDEVTPGQLKLAKNHLGKFDAQFGGLSADEVDPLTCRNWIKSLPLAQRSKHGVYSSCRTAYRWAMRYEFATRSPFERMEPIPKGEAPKAILTPDEMDFLLGLEMRDYVRAWLVLGGFCGLRPIEVSRSDWSAINWESGEFRVSKDAIKRDRTRNRGIRERVVEMTPAALRLLPRGCIGPIIPVVGNTMQDQVRRLAVALARKRGEAIPKKQVVRHERSVLIESARWPHDCLRHSAATYMLSFKGDAGPVAKWLGHTTTKMLHDNYARGDVSRAQAESWWGMGEASNVVAFNAA